MSESADTLDYARQQLAAAGVRLAHAVTARQRAWAQRDYRDWLRTVARLTDKAGVAAQQATGQKQAAQAVCSAGREG